jgi:hypothetical protein
MLLIGAINVALGYCAYDPPPPSPQKIELVLPPAQPGYTPESKPSKWRPGQSQPQPAQPQPAATNATNPPPPTVAPDAGVAGGSAAPVAPASPRAPS